MNPSESKSRDAIRNLAAQLAEFAQTEEHAQRKQLWNDVNSLRKPRRPPVVCHPGSGCWAEIEAGSELVSEDPFLADVELQLRRKVYKLQLDDDTVIEPWWVHPAVELEGEHLWGMPIGYTHSDASDQSTRCAWTYDPPIKEEADIENITPPRYKHNETKTQENLSRMEELLGDILPVRLFGAVPGPGAWLHGWATQLCGVEALLVYMMDRREWVHRLMSLLRDGHLGVMTQFEEMGVLTLNNTGLMACNDLPQPDFDGGHVRLKDLWGRGESQEFQGVSPAQHEDFLLQYQLPILARSGLSFYGCCEDLTNKIPLILSIPNLRKFVCSPWTNLETLVEAVDRRYCIEWRQKATDVVFAHGLQSIRDHLERGLQAAQGCCIQVVLQELETCDGNPQRLREWAALAKEIGANCW